MSGSEMINIPKKFSHLMIRTTTKVYTLFDISNISALLMQLLTTAFLFYSCNAMAEYNEIIDRSIKGAIGGAAFVILIFALKFTYSLIVKIYNYIQSLWGGSAQLRAEVKHNVKQKLQTNSDRIAIANAEVLGESDESYAQAFAEVTENRQDSGLWAKCLVLAEGDKDKATAKYIKLRVAQSGGTFFQKQPRVEAPDKLSDAQNTYANGDYKQAIALALQGDAYAQYRLGYMYDIGEGVTQDYVEAVKWYKLAAAQGIAAAQINIGAIFYIGRGVAPDYAEAFKWFKLAAVQGDEDAQYNFGLMYHDGNGVVQDYVEAVKWCKLAAAQGNAAAQNFLGVMYHDGNGVTQDYAEAFKWYNLAAAQGNANAQNNIGEMYKEGKGVTQDYAEAFKWFQLAAAQGHEEAVKNRDIVARKMTRQ